MCLFFFFLHTAPQYYLIPYNETKTTKNCVECCKCKHSKEWDLNTELRFFIEIIFGSPKDKLMKWLPIHCTWWSGRSILNFDLNLSRLRLGHVSSFFHVDQSQFHSYSSNVTKKRFVWCIVLNKKYFFPPALEKKSRALK